MKKKKKRAQSVVQLGPWHVTGIVNISLAFVFRRSARSACRGPFLFRVPPSYEWPYALHCVPRPRRKKLAAPFYETSFLSSRRDQCIKRFFQPSNLYLNFANTAARSREKNTTSICFLLSFLSPSYRNL